MTEPVARTVELMREALERASYYIARLETAHRGLRVTDMEEACSAWLAAKKKVAK